MAMAHSARENMRNDSTYAMVKSMRWGKPWRQHVRSEKISGMTAHMPWLQCCRRENHGVSTLNQGKNA